LILTKIIKTVTTRYQILWPKCSTFDFSWYSSPDHADRAYSAPPDPLAGGAGCRQPKISPLLSTLQLFSRIFLSQPWHVWGIYGSCSITI